MTGTKSHLFSRENEAEYFVTSTDTFTAGQKVKNFYKSCPECPGHVGEGNEPHKHVTKAEDEQRESGEPESTS